MTRLAGAGRASKVALAGRPVAHRVSSVRPWNVESFECRGKERFAIRRRIRRRRDASRPRGIATRSGPSRRSSASGASPGRRPEPSEPRLPRSLRSNGLAVAADADNALRSGQAAPEERAPARRDRPRGVAPAVRLRTGGPIRGALRRPGGLVSSSLSTPQRPVRERLQRLVRPHARDRLPGVGFQVRGVTCVP